MKHSSKPGACIFCGGGNLTKEHLNPEWLQPFLTEKLPYTHHFISSTKADESGAVTSHEAGSGKLHRQGDIHTKKLRIVCQRCNNGWMSALQERAKPLLLPLILGNWPKLSPEDQKVIATWITMSVMVHEFDHPSTAAISSDERRGFWLNPAPLPDWNIWIGPCLREVGSGVWNHFGISAKDENGVVHPGQSSAATIGQLFYQTFSGFPCPLDPDEFADAFKLNRIWPPNGADFSLARWPVTNQTFYIISEFFHSLLPDPKPPPYRMNEVLRMPDFGKLMSKPKNAEPLRNSICTKCDSGKRYKHCCGAFG